MTQFRGHDEAAASWVEAREGVCVCGCGCVRMCVYAWVSLHRQPVHHATLISLCSREQPVLKHMAPFFLPLIFHLL